MHSAFVLGATGLVGRHLVERLALDGVRVTAHVRPGSPRLGEWRGRFADVGAQVEACPFDPLELEHALGRAGATHAFALVGTTRRRMRADEARRESYDTVDRAYTAALATAAGERGLERLVFLSSIGAGERARSPYLAARWAAEEAVRGSGVPWTIARPCFVVGEREGSRPVEAVLARAFGAGAALLRLLGAPRTAARYAPIDGRDLARGLARAAADPDAAYRILHGEDLRRLAADSAADSAAADPAGPGPAGGRRGA